MTEIRVSAHRWMNLSAEVVYQCIANYRDHHHRFLPPAFSDYHVLQGGHGTGTVVSVNITAAGRTRFYRLEVTEPIPGRMVQEVDTRSSLVTRFQILPAATGCDVVIATRWQGSGGVGGFFERLSAPIVTRRLFQDELRRLEEYARSQFPTGV
jgi:hypothetical protein